jgi:transposase
MYIMEPLELNSDYTKIKKKPKHDKVTFKKYEMKQEFLLPPSTEDYLPKHHIARLISTVIDKMDMTFIIAKYLGGGASAFHPSMMLKVWILGFVKKIYTSRKLEKALHENIAFMWISGRQIPDFKTLSNFRLLIKNDIKNIFKHIVEMGLESGIIDGKDIFIDHTKYQANANPFKMVWKKKVDKQLNKIDEELNELFKYIDELNAKEDAAYGNSKLDEIDKEVFSKKNIDELVDKINSNLNENKVSKEEAKEIKTKLNRTKELLEKKVKYEKQKETLKERSGYSSTDPDASAMKMKRSDDIRPAYNEGVATQNGFIVSYHVSQNGSDSVSFKDITNEMIDNLGKKPNSACADAGYGSFENYEFLKENEIKNFVQYPGWYKENKFTGSFKLKDFKYNENKNSFTCLNDKELTFMNEKIKTKKNGFVENISVYEAEQNVCLSCKKKPWCTTSNARSLSVNWGLEDHKKIVRENLSSEEGIEKRKQRSHDVETVFGDRKFNQGNRRYILRTLEKVNIEAGLHATAHNIKKLYFHILEKITSFDKESVIV